MGTVRLIGQDIAYSASPAMHLAAFAALGLPHRYVLEDLAATALPALMDRVRGVDSIGANVTVPHKATAAALMDELDSDAAALGAVNTVVRHAGRLVGTNTDLPALVDAVRSLRPRPRHAVVLGAGGAGRAAVRAVERAGAESVSIAARRAAHGALPWSCLPALLPDADLLVNATPVGTGIDESPVPASLLHPGLAVLDLVYRPSPTRLVRDARVLGAPAQAGASVLLGQGWRSLELWLGVPAPRAVMAHALRRELGEGADV